MGSFFVCAERHDEQEYGPLCWPPLTCSSCVMEEGAGLAAVRDGACTGAGGRRAGAGAGGRGSARWAGTGRADGGGASKRAAAPCCTESAGA